MDCIFCKIVHGDIKTKMIATTNKSVAFLDAFPLAKGHTLVIPKEHYQKIQDIPPAEYTDLFGLVYALIPKVDKISGSSLLAIHNGRDAGQEVPHVHIHLIPRSSVDSAGPVHDLFNNRPKLSELEFEQVLSDLRTD